MNETGHYEGMQLGGVRKGSEWLGWTPERVVRTAKRVEGLILPQGKVIVSLAFTKFHLSEMSPSPNVLLYLFHLCLYVGSRSTVTRSETDEAFQRW